MRARTYFSCFILMSLSAFLSVRAATPEPPAEDRRLGRELLQEFVNTNTTHAVGTTDLARSIDARLKAAGFAEADRVFLAPPGHPTKGNLIVRLRGRGTTKPVLYLVHLDVVDAPRENWSSDPFKLTEKDGYFHGRGTIDMKSQAAAVLESLLRLKRENHRADSDIIVAFTADEETGGDINGAQWLMNDHRNLIDARIVINPDCCEVALKGGRHLYLGVQTSEKLYVTYQLELTDKGGHSSRPTPGNPIFRLSKALARLSDYQFPLHLTETMRLYFKRRADLESGQRRADMLAMAASSPDPDAERRLSAEVATNIFLRTTCTATQISGGHAESALPQRARATIQCRAIPGETMQSVQQQLTQALADPSIKVSLVNPGDASPESPPTAELLGKVESITKDMWPDAVVLPMMSAVASDSVFTRIGGIPSYGIDGSWEDIDDARAHGIDERIGVEVFDQELEFTYRLMKAVSSK